MLGIFDRPFSQLDAEDLRDLVETRKVREHLHLDYKRDAYYHNHSGTVEMLADVTAMANAMGGYILIGVEEDRTQSDGTPKGLPGIPQGDQEANWIESLCLSSIDERITRLRVRDITLKDGRSCVVIQIPNSLRKPHLVVHEKHRSFRIRHGRSKTYLGMREVRDMIISMQHYQASLQDFVEGRVQASTRDANGRPWLLLAVTPVHVENEKLDPLQPDFQKTLGYPPMWPDPRSPGIFSGQARPRLYGIEATDRASRHDQEYRSALRLFRNGHLEYCLDMSQIAPRNWPETETLPIHSYKVVIALLQLLKTAHLVYQSAEISDPVQVSLHLLNIAGAHLDRWTYPHRMAGVYRRPEKALSIDMVVGELTPPSHPARLVVDRLFNAFGYNDNPHFDSEGDFLKRR